MSQIKAIIFDCFGALYPQASGNFFNTHKDLFSGSSAVLDELNRKIDLGQINRAEFFAGLEKASGMPATQIQAEIDGLLEDVDKNLVGLIMRLKTNYKIGLLSNAGKEEIEIIYRDKIDGLFDAVAVSYEVGSSKPGPEIFNVCVDRLGVNPEECLFVDDSMTNIEAAQKLGMQVLHYPDFGQIPTQLEQLGRT